MAQGKRYLLTGASSGIGAAPQQRLRPQLALGDYRRLLPFLPTSMIARF